MWNKIKALIKKWIEKKLPEVTPPILKPESKPQPQSPLPVGVDAMPWDSIRWIGQANCSQAMPTKVLRSVRRNGDRLDIDWDGNTGWNPEHHNDWEPGIDCYGRFLCFVVRDGVLVGGHVDHMKKGCDNRDTKNIFGEYIFLPPVRPDEIRYYACASNDRKNRTNLVKET